MVHKPPFFSFLTLICTLLFAQHWVMAQDSTPSAPVPSFTASPAMPPITFTPPTLIPTPIVASAPLALPALQPITRENAASIQPLFTLKCQIANAEPGSRTDVRATTFSPVENRLVSVTYSAVCIFNLTKTDTQPVAIKTYSAMAAVFAPDGQSLLTLHNGDDLHKWSVQTGEEIPTRLQGVGAFGSPQILSFSPDGSMMANGGNGFRLWDVAKEQVLLRLSVGGTTAVVWKPDSSGLLTNEKGMLGLYTLYPNLRLFRDATLPSRSSSGLAIGGMDNELIAYVSPEGVRVIKMDGLELVASPERIGEDVLAFSPADPLLLMGATHGGFFGFWDVERDELISSFPSNNISIPSGAAFNKDGTLMAIGMDDGISLWGVPQ